MPPWLGISLVASLLATALQSEPLPQEFILKDVPMVKQRNSYCVPASAAMIAGFHGVETNQNEIAKLSSEGSQSNRGTYPRDMLLAMKKLGFSGRQVHWQPNNFMADILPLIRSTLVECGPIYVSFNPGVFGSSGHGCVIIGYDDRRGELILHNPWGRVFKTEYEELAKNAHGIAIIDPPIKAPIASEEFVAQIQSIIPKFEGDFRNLQIRLSQMGQKSTLVWCNRRDERDNRRFARDTARRDGRKILELSFERNPAVFIPRSPDGETGMYLFVTRPPQGGADFLVREITAEGWSEPELQTLGSLTRHWTTSFSNPGTNQKIWELPMIELHPDG